jgi:hypothetical protein
MFKAISLVDRLVASDQYEKEKERLNPFAPQYLANAGKRNCVSKEGEDFGARALFAMPLSFDVACC